MSEQYFKKSTLAILFTETLKAHPDKKDFLMELWENIKAFPEDKNCGDCVSCAIQTQCRMIDEARMLFHKYHVIADTDDYWSSLVHESGEVIERNGRNRFSKELIYAVLEELSEISRKKSENELWETL